MEQITYQKLFAMYREEKSSNALGELPKEFDESIGELVEQLKKKSQSDPNALKELDNAKKLIIALIGLRRQKIVLRAISTEEAKVMGANSREQAFYEQVKKMCGKQDEWIQNTLRAEQKQKKEDAVACKKNVLVLKDIPEYTASDGEEYGPYKQGDEVSLPQPEAQWMIEKEMAKLIDQKEIEGKKK